MIGLIVAIIIFNFIAFKTNKTLTPKQIAHIWVFTMAFQLVCDAYVDLKYNGYWYFTQNVDWGDLLTVTVLLPPVNMMFLNWYPSQSSLFKKVRYFVYWEIVLLGYELMTLLPQPWGFFHYGWWNLGYSAMLNPILLIILVMYYKKFIN